MKTFEIMINEAQALRIAKALRLIDVLEPPTEMNDGEYLADMFADLALVSDEENQGPDGKKMIHGFCL